MVKHLSPEQLAEVATPLPMSRQDKIERWASLIEHYNGINPLQLLHRLEYQTQEWRDNYVVGAFGGGINTAFCLAVRDPVLKEAGLTGKTLGDVERFFELSLSDLHAFSCDCGGAIDNGLMAKRLRGIAQGENVMTSELRGLRGGFFPGWSMTLSR